MPYRIMQCGMERLITRFHWPFESMKSTDFERADDCCSPQKLFPSTWQTLKSGTVVLAYHFPHLSWPKVSIGDRTNHDPGRHYQKSPLGVDSLEDYIQSSDPTVQRLIPGLWYWALQLLPYWAYATKSSRQLPIRCRDVCLKLCPRSSWTTCRTTRNWCLVRLVQKFSLFHGWCGYDTEEESYCMSRSVKSFVLTIQMRSEATWSSLCSWE